ncbi:sulfite exporter TauE/SafE family protein [bacterium]|nr:sulfite exporter TauE/SafE family protein [bacterium]
MKAKQSYLIGVFIGFFSSLLGMGPGLILVPSLHILYKFPLNQAAASSLVMMIPIAIFSCVSHYLHSHSFPDFFNWLLYVYMGCFAGSFVGVRVRQSVSPKLLKFLFVFFLILIQIKIWLSIAPATDVVAISVYHHLLIGFAASFLSSLMGIGGGVVIISAYIGILGIASKPTALISIYVILFNAILATFHGRSDIKYDPVLKEILVSALVGALIGTFVQSSIPDVYLMQIFKIFLVIITIKMTLGLRKKKEAIQ